MRLTEIAARKPVEKVVVHVQPDVLGRVLARGKASAELLEAWVREYTVALLQSDDAKTAEGRSHVLATLRDLLMNAVLDGVRQARSAEKPGAPDPRPGPRHQPGNSAG